MTRLRDEIAPRVRVVELETLLDRVKALVAGDSELAEHYQQFTAKYIVP